MTSGANFDTQSIAEKQGGAPPPPPAAGDAGNSFLSNMLSALDPMDTESVRKFGADAQQVKDLADAGPSGGGFAVEPGAGEKFIAAISQYVENAWPGIETEAWSLRRHPELGTGPYAARVAEHDAAVMDGDDQSLMPNLTLLVQGLTTLREGIEKAMESYRREDEAHSIAFKAVHPE